MTEDNGDDDTDTAKEMVHPSSTTPQDITEVKKTGIFGFYR
jgi:hypothetical protein